MNPYLATLLTLVIAVSFLRIMDFFAHRGWIGGKLSRKLIHIGTGPIFVLCWLMFPDQTISRYLAALVPLLITVQFALVGTGIVKDEAAVKALSRGGDGIADIVGRRVRSPKLLWSIEKSVAGSLSVFAGGALMTAFIIFLYVNAGVFAAPFQAYFAPIFWIALGGTLIESLPFKDIDNITLTVVSAVIGHLVF